jgi:hypothetical protein
MNNQDGSLLRQITIEDHMFWKTGNKDPAQFREGRRAKTASAPRSGKLRKEFTA